MTDLNIVRIDSLEQVDDEPSQLQSYNSWRYGEEASLYSIAEDSRENQSASRASSQQPGPSVGHAAHALPPMEDPEDGENNNNNPIEVRWVTAQEMEDEEEEQRKASMIPIPNPDANEVASDDEESLGPRHNSRRTLFYFLLLAVALLAMILSLSLTLRNRDEQPPTTVSGGIADSDGTDRGALPVEPTTTAVDPTTTSATTPSVVDVRSLVWDAVTSCAQTNPDDLTNISTMQMEVFEELVYEIEGLVSTDASGSQSLDPKVGKDWILEKWALLMLFFESEGEYWVQLDNWYSYEDVCTWFNQAMDAENSHCASRAPGRAALTKLKLGKFAGYRMKCDIYFISSNLFNVFHLQQTIISKVACPKNCVACQRSKRLILATMVWKELNLSACTKWIWTCLTCQTMNLVKWR